MKVIAAQAGVTQATVSMSLANHPRISAATRARIQALARKHGCLGCHAVAAPLVGPAYQQVAEKYSGDKDAPSALAKRIREGGSGTWGEMAMPPQPQVSAASAATAGAAASRSALSRSALLRSATWVVSDGFAVS